MLILDEVRVPYGADMKHIKKKVERMLRIASSDLLEVIIDKRAIDARHKDLFEVYRLKLVLKDETKVKGLRTYEPYAPIPKCKTDKRPIIVGTGPGGLFAGVVLVEAGLKPLIFERGQEVSKRTKTVNTFLKESKLDSNTNVQFGEGGAGTFSDAKLMTRIKDPYIEYITDKFCYYGADPAIKTSSHPHIGSDHIIPIVKRLREDLIEKGAEYHFEEAMIDIITDNDRVIGIKTDKDTYYSDTIILAIGHSATDTFGMLRDRGVYMERKDLAIGFRVEHPQALIDERQYHGHDIKEPAEYFLRYKGKRGVYSFCMCPGGYVIASSAKPFTIVTNGMSNGDRSGLYANSAILCQIKTSDMGEDLFSGIEYIEDYERKAYELSHSYKAPAQNIADFLKGDISELIFQSTYSLGTVLCDFNSFYPKLITEPIKEAFYAFDRQIPDFIDKGIIVGPETKSSSPIRIKRNERRESISHKGLWPVGEGAGYAGGIMSSALDGIKTALSIIDSLKAV